MFLSQEIVIKLSNLYENSYICNFVSKLHYKTDHIQQIRNQSEHDDI